MFDYVLGYDTRMVDFQTSTSFSPLKILVCANAQCRRCDEVITPNCLSGPPVDRRNADPGNKASERNNVKLLPKTRPNIIPKTF
ncbi:hypothetical protein TNCV_3542471 [Trichonephila clavipes]|uniref:Uncharacterized protein n=1 Tax=Trichonephila clavipes TaxID=2585209 RepID=A0A8X6S5H3_TRICX|nr:hypothetical protein TNCV_3542471 [Trichonephila clavipes]